MSFTQTVGVVKGVYTIGVVDRDDASVVAVHDDHFSLQIIHLFIFILKKLFALIISKYRN